MADRTFVNALALDKNVVCLTGTATIATGTGGVTANNCLGLSVARTGTGAFTITLQDRYPELLSVNLGIAKATAQDLVAQVESVNLSTRTITFRLLTGTTPTDVTSEAATLYIDVKLKNSTILP